MAEQASPGIEWSIRRQVKQGLTGGIRGREGLLMTAGTAKWPDRVMTNAIRRASNRGWGCVLSDRGEFSTGCMAPLLRLVSLYFVQRADLRPLRPGVDLMK